MLDTRTLASGRERPDPGTDGDSDPADVVALQLDLSRVEPSSDLDPRRSQGHRYRRGTSDGSAGTIERREEAVTHRLDLSASVTRELGSDDAVMLVL